MEGLAWVFVRFYHFKTFRGNDHGCFAAVILVSNRGSREILSFQNIQGNDHGCFAAVMLDSNSGTRDILSFQSIQGE